MQTKKPIGYYLKQLDNCLTKAIDEIQSQHGLGRTEWQILNSVYEKPSIHKQEIIDIMKHLADSRFIETVLLKFSEKNFISISDGSLILTKKGQELHKDCFNAQQEYRKKAVAGISEADHLTTISTLQKMIDNIK